MNIKREIYNTIQDVLEDKTLIIKDDTILLGDNSAIDSMKLIELCLALEDFATQHNFEFQWRTEKAMSMNWSMFRTAGSLADAFIQQMEKKQ